MKLLVINPNTSAEMTDRVVAQVAQCAGEGFEVTGATAAFGAPVIASRAAFVVAAHAALATYEEHGKSADAVILACFGDPGLAALREVAAKPVIGLAQASIDAALRLGQPFGIVTAGHAWGEMLREQVLLQDAAQSFRGVEILDTDGLAISRDRQGFHARVQQGVDAAQQSGAATVILGGAGFAGMAASLHCQGTLLDCIDCATAAALQAMRGEL